MVAWTAFGHSMTQQYVTVCHSSEVQILNRSQVGSAFENRQTQLILRSWLDSWCLTDLRRTLVPVEDQGHFHFGI